VTEDEMEQVRQWLEMNPPIPWRAVRGLTGAGTWTDVAFNIGWAHYDTTHRAQYRNTATGIVLRGRANPTGTYTTGTPTATVCTLPATSRPARDMVVVAAGSQGGLYTARDLAIGTDGTVAIVGTPSGGPDSGAAGNWVSLDNISFLTS
jgi:hypothetical protein